MNQTMKLLVELRTYLDTLTITSDNIGAIRARLVFPWDSVWNGWVRDETAAREEPRPDPPVTGTSWVGA